MKKVLLSIGLLALPAVALAAQSYPARVNLCAAVPALVTQDGTNLNKLLAQTDYCKAGGTLLVTADACKPYPQVVGLGGFVLNGFVRATGQCD